MRKRKAKLWLLGAAAVGTFLGNVSIETGQVGLVSTARAQFDPWIQVCGPWDGGCWPSDGNYYGDGKRRWFLKVIGCQIDWGSDFTNQGRRDGFFNCVHNNAKKLIDNAGKALNEGKDWVVNQIKSPFGCPLRIDNIGGFLNCLGRKLKEQWDKAAKAMQQWGSSAAQFFDGFIYDIIGKPIGCSRENSRVSSLARLAECVGKEIAKKGSEMFEAGKKTLGDLTGAFGKIVEAVKQFLGANPKFLDALKCAIPGGEALVAKEAQTFKLVEGIFGFITNPVGTIKNWLDFGQMGKNLMAKFDEVKSRAVSLMGRVGGKLQQAGAAFGALLESPKNGARREAVKKPVREALGDVWVETSAFAKNIPGMFCPFTMAEGFGLVHFAIDGVTGLVVEAIANVFGTAKDVLDGAIQKVTDKLKELFQQFISGRLPLAIANLLPPWLKDVGLSIQRVVGQVTGLSKDMTSKIKGFVLDIKKGGQSARTALTQLQGVVGSLPRLDAGGFRLAVRAGVELLKQWGRGLIDVELGKIVDGALSGLSTSVGVLTSGIDAVCGLVPFVGAAICAATITTGLRVLWDWVGAPPVKEMGLKFVREKIDGIADWIGANLDSGAVGRTTAQIGQTLGGLQNSLGGLLDSIKGFVNTQILPVVEGSLGMNDLLFQLPQLPALAAGTAPACPACPSCQPAAPCAACSCPVASSSPQTSQVQPAASAPSFPPRAQRGWASPAPSFPPLAQRGWASPGAADLWPEVFDWRWYVENQPDLKRAQSGQAQAQRHWQSHGIREGRQAHPNFSTKAYLARYPDLQRAFGATGYAKALYHYLNNGIKEGRKGAP
ncbi:MAG: hypothetical protein HYY84_18930 [Deltaproteobacteria bacterium]|nr:hypothetical protein [Deltaproteobacteria bacterium]